MQCDFFMVEKTKADEIMVLLLCDFLENEQILDEINKEIINLPICNIPLIRIALYNLKDQKFKNILICIKNEHSKTYIEENILIEDLSNLNCGFRIANDFNELMRDIDDSELRFDNYMLLPVTNITNIELWPFITDYSESKIKDDKIILNVQVFESEPKDEFVVYGVCKTREVMFYQRCSPDHELNERFYELLQKNNDVTYISNFSNPKIYVFGKEILALFNENFDFYSFEDLIESLLFLNIYDYKIMYNFCNVKMFNYNLRSKFDNYFVEISSLKNFFDVNEFFRCSEFLDNYELNKVSIKNNKEYGINSIQIEEQIEDKSTETLEESYYLLEKFKISSQNEEDENDDFIIHNNSFNNQCNTKNIINSVIGFNSIIKNNVTVNNCFIGRNCIINANIEKSVVMDNQIIDSTLSNKIVTYKNKMMKIPLHDKFHGRLNQKKDNQKRKDENFFTDVIFYLKDNKDDVINNKMQIIDVKKQINLFTIIWKASNNDLIEAISLFIIDFVDENNLDQSTIDISFFFPILIGRTENEETQMKLILQIHNGLKFDSKRKKNEAMIRIGYALMDDGIVSKDALNNSRIMKGNFFQ
ncbi:Translation initiation factor eIF-2B subunit epsilon [Conglomerata obtusa]